MPKHQMLINVVAGEECRIAIIADGRLEELYQERASAESHVGNIYKGKVTNVEPSIQAAFVDFGQERNGFLHISDLHPMYFAGHDKDETEMVGQKTPRRDRPPIQKCLRRGQEILVQVLKEGIGTKGPTLTSYLSIPGRYLVMMPSMERLGVSRKVEDDDARREMRRILDELKPPSGFGFIIRTAGIGKNKTELKRDLAYLQRLWSSIEQRKKHVNVGELFAESDLVVRTIRDIFSTDIEQIIVDDELAAKRARDFLAIANPRTSSKVALYNDPIPLFHRFDIERQIETISSRTVPLPSGGSLVIDSTEALVAIDINSGKMRDARDAEGTAFKANMEAADEICRQLRLRDLGGVIVNDLIDMRDLRHRRQVETRFRDNLKRDRARTRTSPISQFGILEMTRQRMRPSLRKSIYIDCPHCEGAAQVKSPESVVLDVMRRLALVMHRDNVARVELTVGPAVAFALLNKKRSQIVALETLHNKSILIRVNDSGSSDFVSLLAFDERGGQVEGESLTNMGTYELVPVEAVKGKVIVNRDEAEPVVVSDEFNDQDGSDNQDSDEDFQDHMYSQQDAQDNSENEEDHNSSQQIRDHNKAADEANDANEANEANEAGEAGSEGDDDGQGVKKRRRRRRGGRGRSKRTSESSEVQNESQTQDNLNDSESSNDEVSSENIPNNPAVVNEASSPSDSPTNDSADTAPQQNKPRTGGFQLAGLSKRMQQESEAKTQSTDEQNSGKSGESEASGGNSERDNTENSDEQTQSAEQAEEQNQEPKKRRRRRRGGRRRSGGVNANENDGSNGNDGHEGNDGQNNPQQNLSGSESQPSGDNSRGNDRSKGNDRGNDHSNDRGNTRPQQNNDRPAESSQNSSAAAPAVSRGYHNPALKSSESTDQT